MIIENYTSKKENDNHSYDLIKRFGEGVHLVKYKDTDEFSLLIIERNSNPILVREGNTISCIMLNKEVQALYFDFDDDYEYIKKLDTDELIVRLKK